MYFSAGDRWFKCSGFRGPGCALALWYCNVTTPPTLTGGELTYVDLDLDVCVRPNGCIELLDEDEFEAHQRKYDYPDDVIRAAEDAAREVAELARRRQFPFALG